MTSMKRRESFKHMLNTYLPCHPDATRSEAFARYLLTGIPEDGSLDGSGVYFYGKHTVTQDADGSLTHFKQSHPERTP